MRMAQADVYRGGAAAHLDERRPEQCSLLLSIVASFMVAVAPLLLGFGLFVLTDTYPAPIPALALVGGITMGLVLIGSWLWDRHHSSWLFSFGDLMLWNWLRRHRAEKRLVRNTKLLGFDRTGHFQGDAVVTDDEDRLELLAEIADDLDAKSSFTVSHTDRVERLAADIGEVLGLGETELEKLATAAFLHDVGNIRISEHILRKPEELSDAERAEVESHALLGAMMAYEVVTRDVADGILHHHERWDGEGYPNGKSGDEIPLYARIIAVAEAYDAMTSTRAHRQSLSPAAALEVLRSDAGTQFDPLIVEALVLAIPKPLALFEKSPVLAALRPRLREWMLLFRRVGRVALSSAITTGTIALILGSAGTAS